jgi:hypothetical protein
MSQCQAVQRLWATGLLQPSISDVGHLSAAAMGLVTQQYNTVSKTKCSVAGDKTRLAHTVEYIIGYSWPLALQCRVHPGATYQALGAHCRCSTLSYKGPGSTISKGSKNRKGSGKAGLSKNTTQFSRGRRLLRSSGSNHVNHHAHRVHPERTTKRAKGLPRKRTTAGRSGSDSDGSVVKPLRQTWTGATI